VLQTVCSNLAELQRHGALDSGKTPIPQVVIDAMALVEAIGSRYLWVDALCIIQDSPDKSEQLQIMDLIYMRARLTIIAMAGENADCGLPGIMLDTRKQQPMEVIDGYTFMTGCPQLYVEEESSPHFTRGWTYQEMMHSPRCLFVSSYQFHFRCNTNLLAEDCDGNMYQFLADITAYSSLVSGDLEDFFIRYQQCVQNYTTRSLTYDHDVINAISGILNEMSSRFQVTFHAAIPEKSMCRVLLWCPAESSKKRVWTSTPLLPSWSWVSWKGQITYEIWNGLYGSMYRPLLSESIRIKCPGATEFRNIQAVTDEEQGKQGCKGRECLISLDSYMGMSLKAAEMLGEGYADSSRGPNPNPQSNMDERLEINNLTVSLFCASTIRVGSLRLGETHLRELSGCSIVIPDEKISFLPIYDEENRLCGDFPKPSIPTMAADQIQHLRMVAINSSSKCPFEWFDPHLYPDMVDVGYGSWTNPFDVCECILRIMLIELHGDIAERVAVGQIHPKAWAKASPTIELINPV
ncbi:hypothetical protein BO78DRAFT_324452, partial [Aspergillus sclerotiicarbonarius CBS 121057]